MTQTTIELIQMMLPLIVFQLGLAVFCLVIIWRKGVQTLNPWIWSLIVLFLNLVGPLLFLMFGRKRY